MIRTSIFLMQIDMALEPPKPWIGGLKKRKKPSTKKSAEQIKQDRKKEVNNWSNWVGKSLRYFKDKAPKNPYNKVSQGFAAIPKLIKNGIYNTLYYPKALAINYRTKKHFKENPDSKDPIYTFQPGLVQTRGAMVPIAEQLMADYRGGRKWALIQPGYHSSGRKGAINKSFKFWDKFYTDTGMKKKQTITHRDDRHIGHSSGGDVLDDMAADPRILNTGVKAGMKIAAPRGDFKAKTAVQKAVIGLAGDDTYSEAGKEYGVERFRKQKYIQIVNVSGIADTLVPAKDAVDPWAKNEVVIRHKDATHFGTSGQNRRVNEMVLNILEIAHPANKYLNKPQKDYYKMNH